MEAGDGAQAVKGRRNVYFTRPERRFIETPVYDNALLRAGNEVAGPAVLELPFTTIPVPPGAKVTVDPYLNLVMEI